MRARDLERYRREIGWRDAPPLDTAIEPPAEEPPAASGDLESLSREAASCTRCRLADQRRNVVVGEGDPHARVMFVGEGPGAEEDRTGRPFVGQAGMLLDAMIFSLGLERRQVYIANVVKCRPPGNRDPEADEVAACAPFLDRQIALIRPQVIVALGKPAARRLTGSTAPISALRGRWSSYLGIPVLPTFHPAYLLRSPLAKREVWQDLKAVRERLELPASTTA
jgi:DNA polymerase